MSEIEAWNPQRPGPKIIGVGTSREILQVGIVVLTSEPGRTPSNRQHFVESSVGEVGL
jgi:hypothetical protein